MTAISSKLVLCVCLMATLGPGGTALAQAGDEGLAGVLERMRSTDWFERQAATEALIASDSIPMSAIDAALASDELSPEQRARLTLASVQRYRREPLAGLGVQFGNSGRGAVLITNVVPGFPASDVLRAGDVIVAVGDSLGDGLIGGQDDLRAEILSRRPGEVMPAFVRRGVRTLELGLPLGEYAKLQGAAMLDDRTVRMAMRLRREREQRSTSSNEPAIASGLDMHAWIAGAFPDGTWEGLMGGGDRRDAGVVPGGTNSALASRSRETRLRSFWPSVSVAVSKTAQQARDAIKRSMTSGVVLRGVFLEHQNSLIAQIDAGCEAGEDVSGLELSLDRLQGQLMELDRRLMEEAGRLDEAQRRIEPETGSVRNPEIDRAEAEEAGGE